MLYGVSLDNDGTTKVVAQRLENEEVAEVRPLGRDPGGGLGHLVVLESLRHDLRRAVLVQRDAVDHAGDLHRALLVRHDQQLRLVAELVHEVEEAMQVHVVERGLDLVHQVEGRGPGAEDREQERQRGERTLAAGEQRERLHALPARAAPRSRCRW